MSDFSRPHRLQPTRQRDMPGPAVHHQLLEFTQSTSVIRFSSCLQSFPASGSFQRSQLFTSGGQSSGVSASASVLQTPPTCFHPHTQVETCKLKHPLSGQHLGREDQSPVNPPEQLEVSPTMRSHGADNGVLLIGGPAPISCLPDYIR